MLASRELRCFGGPNLCITTLEFGMLELKRIAVKWYSFGDFDTWNKRTGLKCLTDSNTVRALSVHMVYFTTFSAACKLRCCFPSPITVRFRKKPADTKIGKMWLWSKVFLFVKLFIWVCRSVNFRLPKPCLRGLVMYFAQHLDSLYGWWCTVKRRFCAVCAWFSSSLFLFRALHVFLPGSPCTSPLTTMSEKQKKHFPLWPPVLCSCHCFCNQLLWFYVLDAMYNASWGE